MDPISAEENARGKLTDDLTEEKFSDLFVSVRSLSRYDARTIKTLAPQIFATFIAVTFHILAGISLTFSAILLPQLNATDSGIELTKTQSSWVASSISLISPVAGICGGFLMDHFGRLNTLKIAVVPAVIGWSVIALANDFPMLIIGRLFTGIASAWGTSPAIVYITEIARVDMRGSLISGGPALASLGMVLTFLKGWVMDWRTVAWLSNAYAITSVILIQFFIPESPPWLVSKGRTEQAAKSLAWLHKYQPQPANKTENYAEMQLGLLQKEHQLKLEEASRRGDGFFVKAKEFLKPTGYKPLLILFGLFFCQQYSGIYITLFYSVTFFEEVGCPFNPYLASVLIGVVRFIMSCVNTYILRTFRRRPLVMLSGVGMAACMTVSGFYTQWLKEGTTTQNWVPTFCLLFYVVTSMIGLLTIPWTMTAELFPIQIRGVAHSIANSMANFIMFAGVQMFFFLKEVCHGIAGVQWFFAAISILASIYTFILLPETHGKKLSEITEYFNHNFIFIAPKKAKKTKNQKNDQIASRVPRKDIVKANHQQSQKLLNENNA